MMLLSLEPKHELYIIPKWIYADRIVKKVDVCFFAQIVKIVDVLKTSLPTYLQPKSKSEK